MLSIIATLGCAGILQDQLIFYPDPLEEDEDLSWTGADEEVFLEAEDGARIHGLWFEADGPSRGTVLFLHGNAGSVASWYPVGQKLQRHGVDVLLIDYRTYGKSSGEMSEEGLYMDGDASYEHLRERGYDPDSIVVHGRSLGSTVATHLATEYRVGGLVLETPFVDLQTLAGDLYSIPIPGWLLTYSFDNRQRSAAIEVPTWVVHGTADQIVPVDHARQIHDALANPWAMTVIEGGTHNNLMSFAEYGDRLGAFFDAVLGETDPE